MPNIRFYQVKLAGADDKDRPFAGMPLTDDSIDLFINRRGPILQRYLDEALRVARLGAVIVGLHPVGNTSTPTWNEQLPDQYRNVLKAYSFDEVTNWVTTPLRTAGISDYSIWCIDVPEFLRTPYELYTRLNSSQPAVAPEYQAVEHQLTNIFNDYGTSQGLVLRHQRLLWQAFLPK